VQSARIKERAMMEVEPGSGDKDLSAAEPQARHDFSAVQGFQVVGAEDHGAARAGDDQAWRDALRLELEARATRFHQAVDAAIVLSNDGIIRWLGDPVARLSVGSDALNPTAVILADASLPAASRDMVKTRIELWIAAMTRRVLGPLFALEAIQEGPEVVRDLARQIARSLGILEREPIRAQIKALSQNDRAELRKQGVRFGAYYLFVPALIKPAPRSLALQLWGLRAPGDANELLRAIAPVASSGRTSLPLDNKISQDGYRVAGYRWCGERVVRVDIIERLAGMIRATIGGEAPGVAPGVPSGRASKGFVVSGQMTSLTGCAGDQFASILRSMGFRAVEVRRSEFFGPSSAGEPREEQPDPLAPREAQAPRSDEPPLAQEACEETAAVDPALASPAASFVEGAPADGTSSVVPADQSVVAGPLENDGAGPPSPQTLSASDADMIVVWRPDRRRMEPRRGGEDGRLSASIGPPRRSDSDGHVPVRPAAGTYNTNKRRDARRGTARPPASLDQTAVRADKKHRQQASDCDMPRSHSTTGSKDRAIDPNSPFAKLLELRSLLERQANKRP
jgi:ATP-dependent RNA helicase SUPV3L1/SUV3